MNKKIKSLIESRESYLKQANECEALIVAELEKGLPDKGTLVEDNYGEMYVISGKYKHDDKYEPEGVEVGVSMYRVNQRNVLRSADFKTFKKKFKIVK